MLTKTSETLVKACVENVLSPLTVIPRWRQGMLHIALQLNEMQQAVQQNTSGLNFRLYPKLRV